MEGSPLESGGNVRAALLVVATDLPAIRKITQFLGHEADLGCPRCKFRGEREHGTVGASGRMSYFTANTTDSRTHEEVIQQANEFVKANNKTIPYSRDNKRTSIISASFLLSAHRTVDFTILY